MNSCFLFSRYVELDGKLVSAKEERMNKKTKKKDANVFYFELVGINKFF